MAFNEAEAREFLEDVVQKLKTSAKKYNDNAYQVADIPKEVNEELVDIVGWPLLEVLRIKEIMSGKLANLESIYWDTFLKRQTKEFLAGMYKRINLEMLRRELNGE